MAFSSLGSADAGGDFSPFSFLLYFAFPEASLLETESLEGIRANRVLWHEYQHFLQFTTTMFGLNVFLFEYDRALFTQECIKELLKVVSRVEFPLLVWRNRVDNKKVKELIDLYHQRVYRREEGIGVLFGDCELGSGSDVLLYRGKTVTAPFVTCPFVRPDASSEKPVGLGARVIMEGAASLMEANYLSRKMLMGSNREMTKRELKDWGETREPDSRYYVTIDLFEEFNPYTGLALSDLALATPPEIESFADPLERSPGHRFVRCVQEARKHPQLEGSVFHTGYKEYVADLCKHLGWQTPWEMVTDDVLDFIADEVPFKPLNAFGLAGTILRGFHLRRQSPSYCANPIPDFPITGIGGTDPRENQGHVQFMNLIQRVHPPPFCISNGQRARYIEEMAITDPRELFARLDAVEHAGLITAFEKNSIDREEYAKMWNSSFSEYYIGQRLVGLLWHGPAVRNQKPCLKLDGAMDPLCDGGIASGQYRNIGECSCKKVLEKFLPCSLEEAHWLST